MWLEWSFIRTAIWQYFRVEACFSVSYTQGELTMSAVVGIGENPTRDGINVKVECVGFDRDESTWEPSGKN